MTPARQPGVRDFPDLTVERVRTLLTEAGRAMSTREVMDTLSPGMNPRHASAALCNMTNRGYLLTEKRGRFTYFRPGPRKPSPGGDRLTAARAARETMRRAEVEQQRAKRQAAPAKPPRASQPRVKTSPVLPVPRANAASCSLVGIPDAQRASSARIAADIARFQLRGGRIERLGTTQILKHIRADAFDCTGNRAKGRPTQQRARIRAART